jgi:hypothetical protein
MARKEEKQRPYRVDYFDIAEMKIDKVLVRSQVIRAVTAKDAADQVLYEGKTSMLATGRIIIRSTRFYKKLVQKETYKAVEDMFTTNKAIQVMEVVEKWRALQSTPAPAPVVDPVPVPAPICPYGYAKDDANITAHNCAIHTNTNKEPVDVIQLPQRDVDLDTAAPIIYPAPTAVEESAYQEMIAHAEQATKPLPNPSDKSFWFKLFAFGTMTVLAIIIVLAVLHCH